MAFSEEIPTDDTGHPKIIPRLEIDDDGFLYLYDAVSGREVAMMKGVEVTGANHVGDVQTAIVELDVDPRLVSEEAIQAISEGNEGWGLDELITEKE